MPQSPTRALTIHSKGITNWRNSNVFLATDHLPRGVRPRSNFTLRSTKTSFLNHAFRFNMSKMGALRTTFVFALSLGCFGELAPGEPEDASVPDASDGGAVDEPGPDADVSDIDSDAQVSTVFKDITDGTNWTTFDTSNLALHAVGFAGGTFDGRYIYFAPTCAATQQVCNSYYETIFVRYDTKQPFMSTSSWQMFNANQAGFLTHGNSFQGATFDGEFVYFASISNESYFDGAIVRYNTTSPYADKASWTVFDTSGAHAGAYGYYGIVFDGNRNLYLVPNAGAVATYYDNTENFDGSNSYQFYDTKNVTALAGDYAGGVFDGRYLYLAPQGNSIATRFDTQSPFASVGSWATFDLGVSGFETAAFDGRNVYFVPARGGANGLFVCYDTTAPFDAAGSWSSFDTSIANAAAKGFTGAAYDGQYMYFAPAFGGSIATRYDTTSAFDAATAWTVFDTTKVDSNAKGFRGAIFDGRYVYLVPFNNGNPDGVVARFDAKSPASLPPNYSGSFF